MTEPKPLLSIVIPAYNEADRLPTSLVKIDEFFSDHRELSPVQVVVVDDGSNDDTTAVAHRFNPSSGLTYTVLFHPQNMGKGAAVRTGFAASTGRHVLLCDADLATPIEDVPLVLAASGDDTVVIGSRALDRRLILRRQPLLRDSMGRVFNLLVQLFALPGVWDSQCGFKLFPGPWARRLAAEQRINGFAFDVELLARARTNGLLVREIGVRWRHVDDSRVLPGRHSLQMFRDLIRISVWRITGKLAVSGGP